MNEITIQAKVFQEIWNNYPETRNLIFHVPNEGKRSVVELAQLKAAGLVKGIPDLIFLTGGKMRAIEVKTEIGVLSKEQIKVHESWINAGYEVVVTYGYEHTLKVALSFLK